MTEVYDLTLSLSSALTTYPGDPPLRVETALSRSAGADYNVSVLRLGTHAGTHVDAPRHVDDSGTSVEGLDLGVLVGEAWVCRLAPAVRSVTSEVLLEARIPETASRLLIATSNSDLWNSPESAFANDYVSLSPDGAEWIARRHFRLVGIDYLSIGPAGRAGLAVHRTLLGRGIVVVEGLDLRRIPGGPCTLYCLPLKLVGGDGAPARVVATRGLPSQLGRTG